MRQTAFIRMWLSRPLAISGAADMVRVVIRQSLVQLETPDEMCGQVRAVNSIFIGASNPLGELESGVTAALLGPVGSVALGGLGTLAVQGLHGGAHVQHPGHSQKPFAMSCKDVLRAKTGDIDAIPRNALPDNVKCSRCER